MANGYRDNELRLWGAGGAAAGEKHLVGLSCASGYVWVHRSFGHALVDRQSLLQARPLARACPHALLSRWHPRETVRAHARRRLTARSIVF